MKGLLFIIPLVSVYLSGCAATDINRKPQCLFEMPPIPAHHSDNQDDGSIRMDFGQTESESVDAWLIITDQHPQAHGYIYEDGGTVIELPPGHEISIDDQGNTILYMPGCNVDA